MKREIICFGDNLCLSVAHWELIASWVMIIVTAVTGYLIYITFKSQKEVQKYQYEHIKIETYRFKQSIKPIFKGVIHQLGSKILQDGTESIIASILFHSDKISKEVNVKVHDTPLLSEQEYHGNEIHNYIMYYRCNAVIHVPKELQSDLNNYLINFCIDYKDDNENLYRQNMSAFVGENYKEKFVIGSDPLPL